MKQKFKIGFYCRVGGHVQTTLKSVNETNRINEMKANGDKVKKMFLEKMKTQKFLLKKDCIQVRNVKLRTVLQNAKKITEVF